MKEIVGVLHEKMSFSWLFHFFEPIVNKRLQVAAETLTIRVDLFMRLICVDGKRNKVKKEKSRRHAADTTSVRCN